MTDGRRQPIHYTVTSIKQCSVWAVIYIALIFILPPNYVSMHHYRISAAEYRIGVTALALSLIAVWFIAFWASNRLREYSHTIAETNEGKGFRRLSLGSVWLAWSLPVIATAALILNAISDRYPSFHATDVISITYVTLVLTLITFVLMGAAAREMAKAYKLTFSPKHMGLIMLVFLTTGISFCYIVFSHISPQGLTSTRNLYFMPVWILIISVIIPFLYAWFIGLLAAYQIFLTGLKAKGLLYRQALFLMTAGILIVILCFIALQYIASVVPHSNEVILDYKLILTLIFRLLIGVGFIMLALGARKLKRIEEV